MTKQYTQVGKKERYKEMENYTFTRRGRRDRSVDQEITNGTTQQLED